MKGANQRQRNERLNRALQSFLYGCLGGEGEAGAKPALAVLTELWRCQVWRDARTVNVIGVPPRRIGFWYLPGCSLLWLCGSCGFVHWPILSTRMFTGSRLMRSREQHVASLCMQACAE